MVGVAVKGVPKIGVIHRPFKGETFWAVVGNGHSPNLNKAAEFLDLVRNEDTHQAPSVTNPLKIIVSRSHAGNVQNYTKTVLGAGSKVEVISAAGAGNFTI
jgi:inositol monophosphatase 3